MSQREFFQHEVGAAATHRPDGTGAVGDEEDENMEHRFGVCPFRGVISTVIQVCPRAGTSA